MNNCIDCNKKLSRNIYTRCNSCARKGKLNSNFKGIKKKQICVDCGNSISKTSYYYGNKRCKYCAAQGKNNNFYGKTHGINTRKKMRKLKIIHGMGYKPYSSEFNCYLKKQIKKRDNFYCQLCNNQKRLEIHHIDYNKFNCKKNNLITLCKKCNMKANFDRDYWFVYFTYIMENKYEHK